MVFFMLSGFVIPFSFKGGLDNFAISRFARIFPALAVSVAIGAALRQTTSPTVIIANLSLLAWPLGIPQLSGVYWSLSFELGFYLACVALFICGGLHNVRAVGALTLFGLIFAAALESMGILFACYFFVGLILRLLIVEGKSDAMPWVIISTAGLAILAVTLGSEPTGNAMLSPVARSASMVAAVAIFVILAVWQPSASRPMVYLGCISYSVYLMQDAALFVFSRLLDGWLFALAVPTATFIASALIWEFIERPSIRWGQMMRERLTVRAI